MGFFWKHKILSLILAALALYWFTNPPSKFGFARKGLVVYNRIPISFMDLYVKPSGDVVLLEDLRKQSSQKYWLDNHAGGGSYAGKDQIQLFVGTGFSSPSGFELGNATVQTLRNSGMTVRQMPSVEAVAAFNAARDSGQVSAILIKID